MSITTAGTRIRAGIERALNAGRRGEAEMLIATTEQTLGLLESLADIADGISDGHAAVAPRESTAAPTYEADVDTRANPAVPARRTPGPANGPNSPFAPPQEYYR